MGVREMNQGPNPQVGVYSQLPLRDRTPPAIVTEMNQGSNPHEFPRRDRIPPAVVREPIRGSNPHAVNYSRSNPQACLNHENFSLHFARVQNQKNIIQECKSQEPREQPQRVLQKDLILEQAIQE